MRRKKHGEERIAACAGLLVSDPLLLSRLRDDPAAVFPDTRPGEPPRPVHLEIGCGKGNFAVGMAAAHPEWNFLAMERVADACCLALEKATAASDTRPRDNLRFIIGQAEHLGEWVQPHSLSRIYLNFSDPWPKRGYAKRRLTHRNFLSVYRTLLIEGGELWLKTDNQGLFDFSLEEFAAGGLTLTLCSRNFHNTPEAADNIMTEYEAAFTQKGIPICCARAKF